MRKFKVIKPLYLTFVTYNDSYMQDIPVDSELEVIKEDLCYNGVPSIDYYLEYVHYGYIEEIK